MTIKERPHKKERDEHLDSEMKLSALMDSMPDFVCFKDGEGRWIEANPFALKVFLLEGVDYRGKKNTELVPPDHLFHEALKECDISDEAAWQKGTWRGEEIIPQPDGQAFVFDVIKVPSFHPDGNRKALTIVGRDITERKRIEEDMSFLANNNPLPLVLVDWETGKYLYANQRVCDLFETTRESIIGSKAVDRYINPQEREDAMKLLSERGHCNSFEIRFKTFKGREIWVELNMVLMTYCGKPVIQTVFADITKRKQMEDELQIHHSAIESSVAAVALGDLQGKVTYVNPACARMWGYKDKSEMIGLSALEFWGNLENAKIIIAAALQGKIESSERVAKRKDGTLFDVHISVSLVKDAAGKPLHLMLSAVDITEHRQAEEKLRESELLYRSLFENLLNGFAYCQMLFENGKPTDFIYLAVNSAFSSQTGLQNVVGKKVSEVIPGIQKTDPQLLALYGRVAMTGQPEQFETFVDALKMWFSISVYSPACGYFVVVFDVITERRQAEDELKETKAILQAALDNSQAGIAIADAPDGRLRYVNKAGLLIRGKGEEEAVKGVDINQYVSSWQLLDLDGTPLQPDQVPLARAILYGETSNREFMIRRPDNEDRVVWANAAPILDGESRVKSGIVIFHDITERNQAEEALRESEERHRSILQKAMDGYWLVDMQGCVLDVNEAYCEMSGYSAEELATMRIPDLEANETPTDTAAHSQKIMMQGEDRFESRHRRKDGSVFDVEVSVQYRPSENHFAVFLHDITERKRTEAYLQMSRDVLEILNEPGDSEDFIPRILTVLKKGTGFDALGIRLQEGEDFPYLAQEGFSKDFLVKENSLLTRDRDGGVCRGKDGNVCLECTCGLVVSGMVIADHPLFTKGGSFWSNDTSPLLHLLPSEEPRLNPRNTCIHQGYASVALVPIRSHEKIVGLIQFNDRRKGCFTLETVELMEGVAAHLGAALLRKQTEEKLKQKMHDLERFNSLTVDRELRMVELKKEINAMLETLGKKPKYKIAE